MSDSWIRQCEIIAGGRRFGGDALDVEFSVPFDDDEEPDIATATIYNLAESSVNSIRKDQSVIINAGYRGDVGTIFKGTLQKTATRWVGVDKVTELTVGDGSLQWQTKHVSEAYGEGITASAILGDLTGRFGLELGRLELVNDLTYPTGRIIDAMLKDAVTQIVRECGTEFKISKGRIFIMPTSAGNPTGFVLNKDTGLIGSPEVFEKEEDGATYKGFKARMLLNHRITVDSIIQVQSRTANGTYRVLKGRHRCSRSDYLTEIEVMG
ncbi:MAG: hypothetical protein FWD98_02560 [Defluviitaleaceae bacterium]|nr:hypothetical protein [Defluviitaleaceae bacterium]